MSDKKVDIPGKLKKIILILSILLAFNVAGLVGITVYKHFKGLKAGEVIVTDNIITPEEESGVLENANQSPENENSNKKDALQSTSDTQSMMVMQKIKKHRQPERMVRQPAVLWIVYRPAIHPVDKIPAISAVLAEEQAVLP